MFNFYCAQLCRNNLISYRFFVTSLQPLKHSVLLSLREEQQKYLMLIPVYGMTTYLEGTIRTSTTYFGNTQR